jgi:hypothetical protein
MGPCKMQMKCFYHSPRCNYKQKITQGNGSINEIIDIRGIFIEYGFKV